MTLGVKGDHGRLVDKSRLKGEYWLQTHGLMEKVSWVETQPWYKERRVQGASASRAGTLTHHISTRSCTTQLF